MAMNAASYRAAKDALRRDIRRVNAVLPDEEIFNFTKAVEATLDQLTEPNIKAVKLWIVDHIISSTACIRALGSFCVACSEAYSAPTKNEHANAQAKDRQRRFLYIFNDVLHDAKYRRAALPSTAKSHEDIADVLLPSLTRLVTLAGNCASQYPAFQEQAVTLLDCWQRKAYFTTDNIRLLREASESDVSAHGPCFIPSTHGGICLNRSIDLPTADVSPESKRHPQPRTHLGDITTQNLNSRLEDGATAQSTKGFKASTAGNGQANGEIDGAGSGALTQLTDANKFYKVHITEQERGKRADSLWLNDFVRTYHDQGRHMTRPDFKHPGPILSRNMRQDSQRQRQYARPTSPRRRFEPPAEHDQRDRDRPPLRQPEYGVSQQRPGARMPHPTQLPPPTAGRSSYQPLATPTGQVMSPGFSGTAPPPPPPPQLPANAYRHDYPVDANGLPIPPPPPYHQGPWPPRFNVPSPQDFGSQGYFQPSPYQRQHQGGRGRGWR